MAIASKPSALIVQKYSAVKCNHEGYQVDEIVDGVQCALTARKHTLQDALKQLYLKRQKLM